MPSLLPTTNNIRYYHPLGYLAFAIESRFMLFLMQPILLPDQALILRAHKNDIITHHRYHLHISKGPAPHPLRAIVKNPQRKELGHVLPHVPPSSRILPDHTTNAAIPPIQSLPLAAGTTTPWFFKTVQASMLQEFACGMPGLTQARLPKVQLSYTMGWTKRWSPQKWTRKACHNRRPYLMLLLAINCQLPHVITP